MRRVGLAPTWKVQRTHGVLVVLSERTAFLGIKRIARPLVGAGRGIGTGFCWTAARPDGKIRSSFPLGY